MQSIADWCLSTCIYMHMLSRHRSQRQWFHYELLHGGKFGCCALHAQPGPWTANGAAAWDLPPVSHLVPSAAMPAQQLALPSMQPQPPPGLPGPTAPLQAWGAYLQNHRQPGSASGQQQAAGRGDAEAGAANLQPLVNVAELNLFTYIMRCGGWPCGSEQALREALRTIIKACVAQICFRSLSTTLLWPVNGQQC